ncbi:MAG: Gfo/Idh/MocA family oxidoreductase [Clostridia bacterium]|nr:Gfo/Idh/MocA family oxidoreductase [Clostridia bacterium]MBQ6716419.1 Gfo/Idh/MocA family oxidoreductase [Clostridia bacterium]
MKTYLNAGIIGLGGISRSHISALKDMTQCRIVAVCDIDEAKVKAVAEETGADGYTDWKALVGREDLDIVHICTPHYLHAPMAIEALKAGKHVLTEKPMASEKADALEMIRTAKNASGTLNVIFQNRYNASTVELKRIIESGEAGKLICTRAIVTWHRTKEYYTLSGWRGSFKTEGGGSLINQSIHTLDLMSYLGGKIRRVKGHVSTDLLEGVIEVEDNCHAVVEYENGATGVIYTTNNYGISAPIMLEMVFENATYQLCTEKLYQIVDGDQITLVNGKEAKHLKEKSYWGDSHKIEIKKVYDCILNGEPFEIDGESGYPALELVKAIYESSASGKWISLMGV